jgi:hypothetical protein
VATSFLIFLNEGSGAGLVYARAAPANAEKPKAFRARWSQERGILE